MKTNEAPGKIYLQENTTTDCYGEFWPEWFEARGKDTDIEYTRTDAFINKACEWLEGHIYEYLKMNRTWNEPDYDTKLIGDFRNYIKGE